MIAIIASPELRLDLLSKMWDPEYRGWTFTFQVSSRRVENCNFQTPSGREYHLDPPRRQDTAQLRLLIR